MICLFEEMSLSNYQIDLVFLRSSCREAWRFKSFYPHHFYF